MENQGTVKVKFPREADTKSGWTIDSSFLSRVRHSIPPDEDEWVPSHEEVQAVLLALEVIPTGIFTQPKVEQEPVAVKTMSKIGKAVGYWRADLMPPHIGPDSHDITFLYISPPQRQWVGLNNDDLIYIYNHAEKSVGKAIELTEDKLEEKNR